MNHNDKALKLFKVRAFLGSNVITYIYGLTSSLAGLLLRPAWTCRLAAVYFACCLSMIVWESCHRWLASKADPVQWPPRTFWKLTSNRRWGE